jgi:hypothetical protein
MEVIVEQVSIGKRSDNDYRLIFIIRSHGERELKVLLQKASQELKFDVLDISSLLEKELNLSLGDK